MTESGILHEAGPYWVSAATFGSGRFKPKSSGFRVWRQGLTHSTLAATIGHPGDRGFAMAVDTADTLARGQS